MATNPFVPTTIPQSGDLNLISNYDLAQPIWAPQLFRPYGGQGIEILNLLKAMGAAVPVTRMEGVHWEEDRYGAAFQVGANVGAPGAGQTISFVLAAADIDPTTRGSYPIVQDVIQHVPSGKQYQILTKLDNGVNTTITARPLKATTNEAFTQNDYFFISTNTVPERSTQRDTQNSYQTEYTWLLQDIRNDYSISGSDLTESLQPVRYENGGPIVGYSSIATVQWEYRHLLAIVGALIWGETSTNTNLLSIQTTTGMVEQFRARAVNQNTGGTLTVADFEAMEETLSSNWSVSNFLTLLSGKSFNEISNDLLSDFNQSNVNAVRNELANALFGSSGFDVNQLMATYTFGSLTVNGKNFALKRLTTLDDPTQAAAGSLTNAQRDYGFVLPIGKSIDSAGVPRGFVEMKYKDYAGQNRMMRMWETGGASRLKNTSVDDCNMHVISETGFDFMNLQQCGIFFNSALS